MKEKSHNYIACKKVKVLLSNWKFVMEQLICITLIPIERETIGPDAVDIYDATTSKIIANHVKWQVQLHVRDVLPDNDMLL